MERLRIAPTISGVGSLAPTKGRAQAALLEQPGETISGSFRAWSGVDACHKAYVSPAPPN